MSSTRASKVRRDEDADVTREFENLIRREIELIGEDPDREGLVRTPARVAKSLRFLTQGYDTSAEEVVGKGVFKEEHDNMIMVRDIELYSLCEDHTLPFFGNAHAAHTPHRTLVW